ncbi:hypothetical protein NDU88_001407 [Pleurodeles waltl]|uniref:Uncharacterized protein n=1 Tax=Pleurodeles waltl TaxID=8319 RepID=A0AAV7SZF1_PLEWA|nr:hypothetical protein NDU88_001407 [Pleurodeles waltl]
MEICSRCDKRGNRVTQRSVVRGERLVRLRGKTSVVQHASLEGEKRKFQLREKQGESYAVSDRYGCWARFLVL